MRAFKPHAQDLNIASHVKGIVGIQRKRCTYQHHGFPDGTRSADHAPFAGLRSLPIAKRAKISAGTLYNRFGSNEDMLHQTYLQIKHRSHDH